MTAITSAPPDSAEHLRDALDRAFDRSADVGAVVADDVGVAGHRMRILFSDPALRAQVLPAFAHLVLPPGHTAPELTVRVWTSHACGRPAEPPVLSAPDAALPVGAFLHRTTGPMHVSYQPHRGILNVYDADNQRAWMWVRDGHLPYWERSAPLRHVLHWWMSGLDVQQLHSSAVGDGRGAVLVVGRSGSGRSTTALACAASGLSYLGDDYVLVGPPPRPHVYSTFCSGKLTSEQVTRFPELAATVTNRDALPEEKALVYLTGAATGATAAQLPLAAVLVPVIVGGSNTTVARLAPAKALAALAPSTVVEVFTAGKTALERMRAVVTSVPCFSILLGHDLAGIGPTVRRLLDDLHGAPHEPARLGHPGRPQR